MFARCPAHSIHARSTSVESTKSTARFSPACVNKYPTYLNQCHGESPSGLVCAKYPLFAISSAFIRAASARMKAEDMANKGYFAHTSPEGLSPWHWFK